MGDYISGPNHTLPTGRMGRVRGGFSVMDFVKLITVQEYSAKGMRALGPYAIAGGSRRIDRARGALVCDCGNFKEARSSVGVRGA